LRLPTSASDALALQLQAGSACHAVAAGEVDDPGNISNVQKDRLALRYGLL
jgi:hypothetical protein